MKKKLELELLLLEKSALLVNKSSEVTGSEKKSLSLAVHVIHAVSLKFSASQVDLPPRPAALPSAPPSPLLTYTVFR